MLLTRKTRTAIALAALLTPLASGCASGTGGTPVTPAVSSPLGTSFVAAPELKNGSAKWLQFGYDAGHSGFNPLERTLSASNISGLQIAWTSQTLAEPAGIASDGKSLYVDITGQSNSGLFAVNAATGKEKWSAALGLSASWSGGYPQPAIANGVILSPCSNGSSSAFATGFCGVNATNGKVLWTYYCAGSYQGFGCGGGGYTSPAVYDHTMYVQLQQSGEQADTEALDPQTGSVRWDLPGVAHCPDSAGPATPLPVANKLVFAIRGCAGSNNQTVLCALTTNSGKAVWCDPTLDAYTEALIEGDGQVYMYEPNQSSGDAAIVAVNAKSGKQAWTTLIPGWNYAAMAYANGRVFVESGRVGVYALSSKNGKMVWSYAQNSNNIFQGGVISVANGLVYTNGGAGNNGNTALNAFNEKNGAVVWTSNLCCTGAIAAPVILNGAVYAGYYLSKFALPAKLR